MNKLFAMAVPILPGKTEHWRKFIKELKGDRHDDYAASRKRLNVHERTFFQQTPMGDLVIVTLEGSDPEGAFKNFASGKDDFTRWFVKEVKEIHGIDLNNPPQGAMSELVIDSKALVSAFHSN
jgi:hypothetical protein